MPADDESQPGAIASERVEVPASFVEQANVSDPEIYEEFEQNWPECWERAADLLDWSEEYDSVLGGDGPPFRWFDGGTLNASYNCVDRHLDDRKNQVALTWEGRLGESRTYSYLDLYREVNEFAAALRELGVEEDDVVTLYMPVVPELPIAMLACARIGAPHSVVFAGFSADALATRMEAAGSEYLVTCDGYYRRGAPVHLKNKADNAAIALDDDVAATVVVDRLGVRKTTESSSAVSRKTPPSEMTRDADGVSRTTHQNAARSGDDDTPLADDEYDYDDLVTRHRGETVDPVPRDATDQLFLIYTSGTTGEPTGVRHTTGGYLAHVAWTSHAVLDLEPEDTHWCSADIGWITGHSYTVYGPLALGTTTMLYEGTPDHPEKDRVWELIERNAVNVFYTAPTAIRAFMKWGAEYPNSHDLSSLRLLGTVGEPINPRAWKWYYTHIGDEECPVVDTWWQTETGGMMVTTLPAINDMKPGSAGPPLPGIDARVVDADGEEVEPGETGYLVVTRPWPGMPLSMVENEEWFADRAPVRPVVGDDDWSYFTEDGATVDEDGYVALLGRVDDVINVSGHRFGTTEIESAIANVEGLAEAAVVSGPHDLKGQAVYAYVSPATDADADALRDRVADAVESAIGPIAVPDVVVFTPELPKTRSGKIMRRLLEDIARGDDLGDTSALRNPEVVGELESALAERD